MANMKKYKTKPKIILIPYPAQGHVTPMLKLASSLLSRGFQPIIIIPDRIHHQITSQIDQTDETTISCMAIPDGLNEDMQALDFFSIEKAMEENMPGYLEKILNELVEEDGDEIICVVVDLLASWAIEVGRSCGLVVAGFWPAMFATYHLISSAPDLVRTGFISDTGVPQFTGSISFHSDQPTISTEELPWLIGTQSARKSRFKFWNRILSRSKSLQFLLINSFPSEQHNLNYQTKPINQNPTFIFPIGPLNYNHNSPLTKNPSFWEEDKTCLNWLSKQNPNSVLYISFGSWVSPIGEQKIKTLAKALGSLKTPFIWVLKPSWREGLPDGYIERITNQSGSRIVSWAPQMEILKHEAVGCFLTHCGWNSTMEAIQCKKRLLCYPVAGDQFMNCNYIVQVWKIGVRLLGFGEREFGDDVRMIMEDVGMQDRLMEMYERVMERECRERVIDNLEQFVEDLRKVKFKVSY